MHDILVYKTYQVSDQQIDDILITAFEGGIDYWLNEVILPEGFPTKEDRPLVDSDRRRTSYEMITQGYSLIVISDDDYSIQHILTLDKVVEGIKRWLTDDNGDLENFDANDADLIVQYALFGEIVYG